MHLPRRTVKSIQALPSIHTAFPLTGIQNNESSEKSRRCLIREIEDGIEVVPFERRNSLSAPILSPDQGDKEVLLSRTSPLDKPLPKPPPKSFWGRLSVKQRILAILCVQFTTLTTIGLALMAMRHRSSPSDLISQVPDLFIPQETHPIPRGSFSIPIRRAQDQSSVCLPKMNESIAWQCASDTAFQLNILPSPQNSNMVLATLGLKTSTNSTIHHGHQAPATSVFQLNFTNGASTAGQDGPAYHFSTTYNRTVLLKDYDLAISEKPKEQPAMQHPTFKSEETLWRCVFLETVIDGYLYVDKNTTAAGTLNGTAMAIESLPMIPYELKLVEQRIQYGKRPYCERMKVQDGALVSISKEKRMLSLTELKAEDDVARADLTSSAKFRIRQEVERPVCMCKWMVQ